MRATLLATAAVSLLACARPPVRSTLGLELVNAEPLVLHRWSFDPAPHLATPASPSPIAASTPHTRFLAVYGRWTIEEDATAPSAPHVLSQEGLSAEPARILVEKLGFGSAIVRARCRVDGSGSCGVIFGAEDEDDYFVARADPSSGTVRLLHRVGTVEHELASTQVALDPNRWITLAVWTRAGDTFVSVDDTIVTSALGEPTLTKRFGRVGLFAQGPARFDDLAAMELDVRR